MRVGINALTSGVAGVKTYLINLIDSLAKIDNRNEYVIFITPEKKELFEELPKNFKITIRSSILTSTLMRITWEQAMLPFILKKEKIDILFSTANINPLVLKFFKIPSLLTIHTNIPWLYPKDSPSYMKSYIQRVLMELSIRSATKVIALSQKAKEELANSVKISPEKIKCVYHGRPNKRGDLSMLDIPKKDLKNYGIYQNYILYIASMVRYRNHIRLLKAYYLLKKKYPLNLQLILIGKLIDKRYFEEVTKLIKEYNLHNDVIYLEYVPHENIPKFYHYASLYVFPSYCEVFGLTQIEAMVYGIPVVSSNVSAMPEISGNAAIYFNPFDVKDMAYKMKLVLSNTDLQKELIIKGYKRVTQFSWEKTAKETLTVINEIV